MLNEICQTEKDKYHMNSYAESKKVFFKKTKLINTENRLVVTRGAG